MTPTSAREMPVIDIDPYADEHLADPSTYYDLLLKAGDVAYLPAHDVYVMGRHASIVPALKDWETFSSTGGSGIADVRRPDAWRAPSPIVEVDPPRHTEVRRALQKVLSPAVIRKWREDFEVAAQALVAELLEKGEVDGVQDLSEAYVSSTFPDALGIARSPERRRNLYILGELNFDGQGPNNARYKATQARADAIDDWYQAQMQREAMVPGGFGENIFKAADAGEIAPELEGRVDAEFPYPSGMPRHPNEARSSCWSGRWCWYRSSSPTRPMPTGSSAARSILTRVITDGAPHLVAPSLVRGPMARWSRGGHGDRTAYSAGSGALTIIPLKERFRLP